MIGKTHSVYSCRKTVYAIRMYEVMAATQAALDSQSMRGWLESGSVLGYARECGPVVQGGKGDVDFTVEKYANYGSYLYCMLRVTFPNGGGLSVTPLVCNVAG